MKQSILILLLVMTSALLVACGDQGLEGDWMFDEQETRKTLEDSTLTQSEKDYVVSMFNTQDLAIDSSGFTMKNLDGEVIECKFESATETRATGECYNVEGESELRGVWQVNDNNGTTQLEWTISSAGETAIIVYQPVG